MEEPHRILEATSAMSETEEFAREKRPCITAPEVQTPASHVIEPLPPTEDRTFTLSEQDINTLLEAVNKMIKIQEQMREESKKEIQEMIRENKQAREELKKEKKQINETLNNVIEDTKQANEELKKVYEQDFDKLEQRLKEATEESRMVTRQIEEKCQTIKINSGPETEPMHAEANILDEEVIKQASERDTCMEDQPTENVKTEVALHPAECREERTTSPAKPKMSSMA
ncbi:reticulocyte-binding protein 2 homolog a-like [Nilaparvata lugens]|uniref:reticulocyte-binding protein 2 homolog a-like n=1 Tax=Nilaparvata lugens TaxID=108931 RepID=UPI00193DBBB9|nr:reticulocyte-binding protein 2 homolog a-like [Nilaparvata lugens]